MEKTLNMHSQIRHEYAVSLLSMMLSSNAYVVLDGRAALVMAKADLYAPKIAPENRGEEFAVKVHWVPSEEDAAKLRKTLEKESIDAVSSSNVETYNAIVIGRGIKVLVSQKLQPKLIYEVDNYEVESCNF